MLCEWSLVPWRNASGGDRCTRLSGKFFYRINPDVKLHVQSASCSRYDYLLFWGFARSFFV